MASVLANSLIATRAVAPNQIYIHTRTWKSKTFPKGANLIKDAQKVVDEADIIFVCTRPQDVPAMAKMIKLVPSKVIISIAAGLPIKTLQKLFASTQILRILPGYSQKAAAGAILYQPQKKLNRQRLATALALLGHIGKPVKITESKFNVASDLSGCGPAFWAFMLNQFIKTAVRHGLNFATARELALQTFFGTAQGFKTEKNLEDVVDEVATPGGITREGIKVLEKHFPKMADEIFKKTLAKYNKIAKHQ